MLVTSKELHLGQELASCSAASRAPRPSSARPGKRDQGQPVSAALAVMIIGLDREPTTTLAADLRRLSYHPELISWPPRRPLWRGPRPAAVMVDLRLLGVDTGRACQAAREHRVLREAPLIAVVPEQEASRLDLALGFDDLLLSPYRLAELAARLRLARWRAEAEPSNHVMRAGRLTLNQVTYQVAIAGRPVEFTLKEYQLLLFLMRQPGRVFTREELLYHVWDDSYFGGTRTVDVHIRRLRAKTAEAGELIETVRGVGYRLNPPSPHS
jgi:two-component system alkaline phosphatase synthesis response regulator PhoP